MICWVGKFLSYLLPHPTSLSEFLLAGFGDVSGLFSLVFQ